MYLLDTNVVSEFQKISQGKAHIAVAHWADSVSPTKFYLSAVNILEIETGIALLEKKDALRAAILSAWLRTEILTEFKDRILPFDTETAMICARLLAQRSRPYRDALIAATSIKSGFTLVTRNVRDFADMNVRIFNPWES